MKKKRTVAMTIFTSVLIAVSGLYVYPWYFVTKNPDTSYIGFSQNGTINQLLCALLLLCIILSVVGGIGILFLRNWGRLLAVVSASLIICLAVFGPANSGAFNYLLNIGSNFEGFMMSLIISFAYLGFAIPSPFVVFYLTRPKVKERFIG